MVQQAGLAAADAAGYDQVCVRLAGAEITVRAVDFFKFLPPPVKIRFSVPAGGFFLHQRRAVEVLQFLARFHHQIGDQPFFEIAVEQDEVVKAFFREAPLHDRKHDFLVVRIHL